MARKCELCDSAAKIYCESDQASLCWDCDAKVHSANFLVEKHPRTLLCRLCQSPTPWTGSGSRLAPTLSVCETCVGNDAAGGEGDRDVDSDEEEDDGSDDDDDGSGGEDDEDNQVVPWSSSTAAVNVGPGWSGSFKRVNRLGGFESVG
ncbi:B-box domain protein 31 [Linum perenne]